MNIVDVNIAELKPYKYNPRKNDEAVKYLTESIRQFGFKVPLVIDRNNVIVAGHTRYKAAQRLKISSLPCIVADDLTDEQIKAFRLADNKVAEKAEWDFDLLDWELADILDIDMELLGFDTFDNEQSGAADDEDNNGYYGDERERTNREYNLDMDAVVDHTEDFWQMPIIEDDHVIPTDVIGFNYALTSNDKRAGIHFYIDDYQFERIWNEPDKYIDTLSEYQCIFSPDFSLYMDMPMPTKLWNIYRSRLIGAYYQNRGIKVIPTISWAEPETFKFCFKGIPKGSTVSISTIGVKRNKDALAIWTQGMDEMIKQIEPKTILIYGGKLDYDYGDIETIYYNNHVLDRWKGGN